MQAESMSTSNDADSSTESITEIARQMKVTVRKRKHEGTCPLPSLENQERWLTPINLLGGQSKNPREVEFHKNLTGLWMRQIEIVSHC